MIKEAIGVGATINDAMNQAKLSLNAPFEAEVKFEIVAQPKKKTLGLFGGSQAKVKAYYDDGKKEPVPEAPKAPKAPEAPKAAKAPEAKKEERKPQPKKPAPAAAAKKEQPKKEAPAKTVAPEVDLTGVQAKENDATNYLKSILQGMGFNDAGVTVKETAEDFYFEITCSEDYGNIIGRRGETLDALQYLTRLYVNRFDNGNKRVSLNVGDYRKRREETLKGLAKRQASRAIKYGRNCVLEPMNPYERRIIHTAVQDIEGVTSHSVGEGDSRRVVIAPVGGEKRQGGYNNSGYNNNGGYNRERRGGDRREKRPPYVPEASSEPREHKVDAATSSRYGKIEPKKTVASAETTEE